MRKVDPNIISVVLEIWGPVGAKKHWKITATI